MKLTCCCGASIEFDYGDSSERVRADEFQKHHAPCPERWRASIPEPTFADKILGKIYLNPAFYRDLRDFPSADKWLQKPIVQHGDQAIKGICCHCGSSMVYRRIDGITVICYTCCKLNVEPLSPDPYARFKVAMDAKKRVFEIPNSDGLPAVQIKHPAHLIRFEADKLYIEGLDIPVQPTKDYLDKQGVELNGECRIPKAREIYAPSDSGLNCCLYGGRRWILKRKQPDAGFEKWWTERGRLILLVEGKVAAFVGWTAAQEAQK